MEEIQPEQYEQALKYAEQSRSASLSMKAWFGTGVFISIGDLLQLEILHAQDELSEVQRKITQHVFADVA